MRTWPCFLLLAACGSNLTTNENNNNEFEEEYDTTAPEIVHTPVSESLPLGEDVPVTAIVTDSESGVIFVRLYFKNETDDSSAYSSVQLAATGVENEYAGTIPGDEQRSGGMNYYLEGVDAAQNTAWSPTDGADDPYHFRVYVPE